MEGDLVPIVDLQRVQLKAGDVLVVRFPSPATDAELERVLQTLLEFFPRNRVLVTTDKIELFVVEAQ